VEEAFFVKDAEIACGFFGCSVIHSLHLIIA
jgi:hypothetical protein